MATIDVSYTDFQGVNRLRLDPTKPITTSLLKEIVDNTEFVKQWLGDTFVDDAITDHNHDGVNSSKLAVGSGHNLLSNGSFEQLSGNLPASWVYTVFSGGTLIADTSNNEHGVRGIVMTSASTANGGGDATVEAFVEVAEGLLYRWGALISASVINVSSKIEIFWSDDAEAPVSTSTVYNVTDTPTTPTLLKGVVTAPANARLAKIRVTGGVPGAGSATGSIRFDGVFFTDIQPIGRELIFTGTAFLSGSLGAGGSANHDLNAPVWAPTFFFDPNSSGSGGMSNVSTATDLNDPDSPRFRVSAGAAKGDTGGTYDLDYRWLKLDGV